MLQSPSQHRVASIRNPPGFALELLAPSRLIAVTNSNTLYSFFIPIFCTDFGHHADMKTLAACQEE